MADSCFARAQPASCEIFRQADERILSRRFNGANWSRPVLQKRNRQLAPFFGGRASPCIFKMPIYFPAAEPFAVPIAYNEALTARVSCGILSFRLEAAPFGFVPKVIFIVKVIAVHRRAVFFHFLLDE